MNAKVPTAENHMIALPAIRAADHPVESAARHAVTRVPLAKEGERADAVVGRLAGSGLESVEAVFVVDPSRVFKGALRLVDLFSAPKDSSIGERMDPNYPRVGPHDDQEHVAALALDRRATSVAVVDNEGRLIGAVPALSLLEILRHEHVEDLHRLAGIQRETVRNRSALEAPPARRARHRLPWLLVGLAGSMLAAAVISRFQRVLEANLAVAFFVPAIVYLADAIGTQTEAIAVRGLSLSRLSLRHLLADELRTGLLIGATLGALSFPVVAFVFGDVRLGASVAAAVFVAGGAATSIGLLLPWLFQRMGTDPAFGSGPVATIIQDVLSLVVYFAIASLMVGPS
jgi:magnesium transporter